MVNLYIVTARYCLHSSCVASCFESWQTNRIPRVPPRDPRVPPQGPRVPPQGPQGAPSGSPGCPLRVPRVPPQGPRVPPQGPKVPPQGPRMPPQGPRVPPQDPRVPPLVRCHFCYDDEGYRDSEALSCSVAVDVMRSLQMYSQCAT